MSAILNEDPAAISQVTASIAPALQRVVHRCLEKSPEQRFQSASDLAFALDALSNTAVEDSRSRLSGRWSRRATAEEMPGRGLSEGGIKSPQSLANRPRSATTRRYWVGAAWAALALLIAFAFWWATPLPDPKILDIYPVTNSARQDYLVRPATDGARIFYQERRGDHYDLMQVSVHGGESQKMPAPFPNTLIWDVSPDGTHYLITSFTRRGEPSQLWSWQAIGGQPVKLGNMISGSAIYSPDGKMIAFHIGRELWIGASDGSSKRKLATLPGAVDQLAWSPDSKRLRFTVAETDRGVSSMWEIDPDGQGLRNVLPHWPSAGVCCGNWTLDGRYFLFVSSEYFGDRRTLWAVREKGHWLRRSPRGPFLLASEAGGAIGLLMGRDGEHVYFFSDTARTSDLQSLDLSSHQFASFLPRTHALLPGFSRDRQWVAYVNTVTHSLWRSRVDGADARELPFPGVHPGFPRWSPDGKTLAFSAATARTKINTYVVDAEGGRPEPLVPGQEELHDPDWSGDGSQLVVAKDHPVIAGKEVEQALAIVNWQDRSFQFIPNSEGFGMPRWSPDGRWIAALGQEDTNMYLYNVAQKKWKSLAQGKALGLPVWSADSAYLYFQRPAEPGQPLVRIRLSSGAEETVANFQAAIDAGATTCTFLSLAPDGHPIVNLANASDIYGATLIAP